MINGKSYSEILQEYSLSLCLLFGGKWSQELFLLLLSLEFTMSNLGRCINELDIDLFSGSSVCIVQKRLSQCDWSLLCSNYASLKNKEIIIHHSIVGESSKWSYILFSCISLCSGIILDSSHCSSSYSVDLLVDFSSMVIAQLTCSWYSPLDCSWMPGSNTTNSSQSSMSFSRQSCCSKSLDCTLHTFTVGYSNGINHFEVLEDFSNRDFLLKFASSPVNLLSNGSTINLDFNEVSFSLTEVDFVHLSGS